MMELLQDFGAESEVASFRYDDPPALCSDRRGCIIAIGAKHTGRTLARFRLKGYVGPVSDLLDGSHVRLYRSTHEQIEFGRYELLVDKREGTARLPFADLEAVQ